jgi:hypothetical protein
MTFGRGRSKPRSEIEKFTMETEQIIQMDILVIVTPRVIGRVRRRMDKDGLGDSEQSWIQEISHSTILALRRGKRGLYRMLVLIDRMIILDFNKITAGKHGDISS